MSPITKPQDEQSLLVQFENTQHIYTGGGEAMGRRVVFVTMIEQVFWQGAPGGNVVRQAWQISSTRLGSLTWVDIHRNSV